MPLISDFVRPDSKARLFVDKYDECPDVAATALFLGGNEPCFKSLAETICYSLNELLDEICVSDLRFVENETGCPVNIRFEYGDQVLPLTDGTVIEAASGIVWTLTESEASVVATSLHGLGYAFEHLHFNPTNKGMMAAFCFIENR